MRKGGEEELSKIIKQIVETKRLALLMDLPVKQGEVIRFRIYGDREEIVAEKLAELCKQIL
ncbi:phosphotransferase system HPr-like phosphotransfer protein [Breznakia sp. PF5-3]|uniref:hypothetical protein n=1 Tax=unclassified Breznakia TaxID=2623764 RepID=UPI002404CB3A|nr:MULTISPECIES: hypothetical protein [unclassified Breznakia]MDF9825895.1 phosphotransferase system HPr-like phosphotransfer protein [Breznakia sp. PM6-1]MDF9836692.1 phosphotransferase system HPr-like phosphotransfer protein [Breznakia sp. PF5-3]MDF9838964.1 phosphotransferase system HPr-like phosphotransfer protein [Breznakia sp. PFB2-8]MDF9860986.1 phosphotransferase system HPr-like phosphotransfer protein [Breznakia sp. PH5-24]